MARPQIHYDIKPLLKTEANIYLLVGEKSNGKSYQVKNEVAIPNYLNNNMRFALIRRWDSDMPNSWISQYFNDVDVRKTTSDKYDCICPYKKAIYFGNYDEEKLRERPKEKIGYIMPLSMEQHFSRRLLFRY